MSKTVFVTVGSTSFDELVKAVCSSSVLKTLQSKGYDKVILQIGRGFFTPPEDSDLELEWYTYKKNILNDIKRSSLVISHAGAGCILESLEEQKPLIVVVNENLMENHQFELASQLDKDGTLEDTLTKFSEKDLRRYTPAEPHRFPSFLDQIMGFE